MDFSDYKFRCSQLGKLMTDPRAKKDKLSETTKSYLKEIKIAELYGREKDITNKYLEKGILTEEDSLTLVTHKLHKPLLKNKEELNNEWIKGTPDVIQENEIDDIKSCWDIWTFADVDGSNKDYYWQLQGYMWLTGKSKAKLFYCLNNTPEHLIVSEKQKLIYRFGLNPDSDEFSKEEIKIEHNLTYNDIDESKRVKVYEFEFDEWQLDKLKQRISDCREYLQGLEVLA